MMTPLLTGRAHSTLLNTIHHCDLFTLCDWLYEAGIKVDMILCDLPYGTTACSWDGVIAFEPMWTRFKRVIKPCGAIVLTASQPFTSRLVCSNLDMFKYSWMWLKSKASDFINANYRPMKKHEDVIVFSSADAAPGARLLMSYFPQAVEYSQKIRNRRGTLGIGRDRDSQLGLYTSQGMNYPNSVLEIASEGNTVHPTQKPVALFEYLIRTYTRPGELVLDPTCGSGTTALAARNTQRQFVCGDSSAKYVQVARDRLAAPYTLPLFAEVAS